MSSLVQQDYGSASYWDERYSADETPYDWYQDYSALKPYLDPYLQNNQDFEILITGCGNSTLGADMYDAGFVNITNIDISTVVIAQMTDHYANREEMEFTVMDARRMEYVPDQCFDVIIDKGLMDAFLCSENNLRDTESYLKEMYRTLKTGGVFLMISHGPPDKRMTHLEKHLTGIEIQTFSIPKPEIKGLNEDNRSQFHFMYACRKIQN